MFKDRIDQFLSGIGQTYHDLKADAIKIAEAQKGEVIHVGGADYKAKRNGAERRFREVTETQKQSSSTTGS